MSENTILPPGTPVWSGQLQIGHVAYPREKVSQHVDLILSPDKRKVRVPVVWMMDGKEMISRLGLKNASDDMNINLQFGGNPTTGALAIVEARAPLFASEEKVLYHYTSFAAWQRIQKSGYIQPFQSVENWPDAVTLTDEANLNTFASWASGAMVDKLKVRMTVRVKDATRFTEVGRAYGMLGLFTPNVTDATINAVNTADIHHWWVTFHPIHREEWLEVRVGDQIVDTEIHLDKYRPRTYTEEDQPWLNNEGEIAKCDFCSVYGTWRYFCRPFQIGEWRNGGDDLNPQDADWAACTGCGELIEKRDRKALIAKAAAALKNSVILSGKHGTETGRFDPEGSAARIRGFFQHYRKTRVFIGSCDFCNKHGASVKWFYPIKPYDYRVKWSKTIFEGKAPWIACEVCADMIERNKRGPIIERMQRSLAQRLEQPPSKEQIDALPPWLESFYAHRNGPRYEIPDRPVPPAQAPLAAQAALEQQLSLLRWLEGSAGKEYVTERAQLYDGRRVKPSGDIRHQIAPWAQPLQFGEPYYWEPRIADAIRQAAEELRDDEKGWLLERSWVPAPQGFFYSDTPLNSGDTTVRAIGWTICWDVAQSRQSPVDATRMATSLTLPLHGGVGMEEAEGLVVTFWTEQDRALRPTGVFVWPFGVYSKQLFTTVPREISERNGERPEIFASMLQFIRQRIVVSGHRMPVSSALRKRIEREHPKHSPTVRVITLRRVASADYQMPSEPTGRHLTVQFRVPGFWRHNHCFNPHGHAEAEASGAGCNDHGEAYVSPHMRGPADAPLKFSRGSVFDVSR